MKNYPALKCYTSENQYKALVKIRDTKSIMGLITDGRSSKTLGSLLRSMWIQEREYTNDEGIRCMGWFVTDEGANAITTYESVYEAKKKLEEEKNRKIQSFIDRWPELEALRQERNEVEEHLAELKYAIKEMVADMECSLYGVGLSYHDMRAVVNCAVQKMENDKMAKGGVR